MFFSLILEVAFFFYFIIYVVSFIKGSININEIILSNYKLLIEISNFISKIINCSIFINKGVFYSGGESVNFNYVFVNKLNKHDNYIKEGSIINKL